MPLLRSYCCWRPSWRQRRTVNQLSVIEVDAYADMILVDGDPLADVSVLADYDKTIKVVIKDGEIYQNNL